MIVDREEMYRRSSVKHKHDVLLNRQQRRQIERMRKKQRDEIENKGITRLEYDQMINSINAVKMVSMLVLRNGGWGNKRLLEFSDSFNEILRDVSNKHLSLTDISQALEDETGLTLDDLRVE